ncbi:MAG: DMT family transporter [Bacteroidales bacterium]|nr:DMT family transporter [Bacteroidales bacterium]
MGQGVGLVLSKQGVMHYSENIVGTDFPPFMVPFAGTFIRAIMGLGGFLVMIFMQKNAHLLREAFHNSKGLGAAVCTTIFGPFIGVSLSLMAVQYTATGIAQTIMALTPVLILLPAHIFLHQKITLQEVLGAFISIAGVALFFFL